MSAGWPEELNPLPAAATETAAAIPMGSGFLLHAVRRHSAAVRPSLPILVPISPRHPLLGLAVGAESR
jgi:hypothetical protein